MKKQWVLCNMHGMHPVNLISCNRNGHFKRSIHYTYSKFDKLQTLIMNACGYLELIVQESTFQRFGTVKNQIEKKKIRSVIFTSQKPPDLRL